MKKQNNNKHHNEKEHYVPQFYLKNFSINDKLKKIWVYDKQLNKRYKQSIGNVAQKVEYYTTEQGSIEDNLSNFERNIAPYINNLFKKDNSNRVNYESDNIEEMVDSFSLDQRIKYKKAINLFVIMQYIRAEKSRKEYETRYYNLNKPKFLIEFILTFLYAPMFNSKYLYFPKDFIYLNINDLKKTNIFKNSNNTENFSNVDIIKSIVSLDDLKIKKMINISMLPKIDLTKNYINFYKYFYLA